MPVPGAGTTVPGLVDAPLVLAQGWVKPIAPRLR
jgi:hypothetical protein